MIDIAKARALCAAGCTSYDCSPNGSMAITVLGEALDEIERERGLTVAWKKLADGRADTIDALREEGDALKAELDTLKERLTYGPAKAFAEIHALKAEVERLNNYDTIIHMEGWPQIVKDVQAENARLRKALRAAIPYVSATSINADMWAALAAPQTGGDDE